MAAYTTYLPLTDYILGLGLCLCGAFIMRSSACTINDIFDRKVDAGVGVYPFCDLVAHTEFFIARTKNRPMASGRVSLLGAWVFLFIQYIVGAGFFYLSVEGIA